jgi:3-hydroxybutyryl-CoA dehydrogenase
MTDGQAVAIIGAGTMGWQISLQLAAFGTQVRLYDQAPAVIAGALRQIDTEARELVAAGELPETAIRAAERVAVRDSLEAAVDDAWLVIEAIPERVDLKRALFAELSRLTPAETILATNSSSFKSRLLADVVERPERLLNAHFYNYPWRRSGVELMTCGSTDPAVIEGVRAFLAQSGLVPVVVMAESTGFLYNRIWHVIKKESLKIVAEGVARPEDVDRMWCLSWQLPLGPFAMMDRVGLDVVLDIERHYAGETGNPDDEPPQFLVDMVEQGRLGRKTGAGFYEYPNPVYERPGWPRS